MKIHPIINIKQQRPNVNENKRCHTNPNSGSFEQVNELPKSYPLIMSFKGESADFQTQLSSLKGIHCPACGVKMLAKDELRATIREADKVRTVGEYSKILNKNIDSMQPKFKKLAKFMSEVAERNPNLGIHDAFNITRSGANKMLREELRKSATYLKEMEKENKFSDADKEIIDNLIEEIKGYSKTEKPPKVKEFKENLQKNIEQMESPKKWEMYTSIKENIQNAYNYRAILNYKPEYSQGLTEGAFILENVLRYSKSNINKIYTNVEKDERFNSILACTQCQDSRHTHFKNWVDTNPDMLIHTKQYLDDIAQSIVEDKLKGNSHYLQEVLGAIRKASAQKLSFTLSDLDGIAASKVFHENRTPYRFASYENIPCACCGGLTITHEQRVKLYEDIAKCKTLSEVKNIAQLNSKHIMPRYRFIFDRYKKVLADKPNITENDMMYELRVMSKQDLKKAFKNARKEILQVSSTKKLNSFDKELVNDFIFQLDKKYSKIHPNTEFIFDEYDRSIDFSINKMQSEIRIKLANIAKNEIRKLYMQDKMVMPQNDLILKLGSSANAMFQNIFKMSILTVDHILPKNLGGGEEDNNKIGYCKDCNNEKSDVPFIVWYKYHPELKTNIPKHLNKINEIIKEENMIEMKNYPKTVLKTINTLLRDTMHPQIKLDSNQI